MNHWSQVASPSILPLAPAVNPVDVAKTWKPPLAGGWVTSQGIVARELPLNRLTVVPAPRACYTAQQNDDETDEEQQTETKTVFVIVSGGQWDCPSLQRLEQSLPIQSRLRQHLELIES